MSGTVVGLTLSSDNRPRGARPRGVFVVFALVAQILADAADLDGVPNVLARDGIWAAAVLFPAGFFLSSATRGTTQPNRLIVLVYAGAVALTTGVLALGIGLLAA
jgi:hypothetical protein